LSFSSHVPPTTAIYTLSLHDALPIFDRVGQPRRLIRAGGLASTHRQQENRSETAFGAWSGALPVRALPRFSYCEDRSRCAKPERSEEHTSETPVTIRSRMPSSA